MSEVTGEGVMDDYIVVKRVQFGGGAVREEVGRRDWQWEKLPGHQAWPLEVAYLGTSRH